MKAELKNARAMNMMTVIEPVDQEQVTSGGIIIPELSKKRKPKRGIVRLVSEGSKLKVGELVLYPQGIGIDIMLSNEHGANIPYDVIRETDIIVAVSSNPLPNQE